MAKAKLSLSANPTFKAVVGIAVAGEATVPVQFVFKHRTKSALKAWREGIDLDVDGVTVDHVLEMACGWDLEDPFGPETVGQLLEQYPASGILILIKYMHELTDARLGNSAR